MYIIDQRYPGDFMRTNKRITGPLTMMFGVIVSVVAFAAPANAADPVYPAPAGTQVLGVTQTAVVPAAPVTVAGVTENALAFTGTNAIGVGALGGLLLVGGGLMLVAGKRRKVNA